MPLKQIIVPLSVILCLACGSLTAQTPPSMEKDPLGYLHYLRSSLDPQAVAVRVQIENGPADLAQARASALKDGLVLDATKLQRPLPPDDQNAAPIYAKLAQMLKDKPLGLPMYAQPLGAAQTYTPEQIAAVQKIYDSRPDVWALVHQAADRPQCVVARNWKDGPAILFPDLAWYREDERLLRTETYLLAAQGKYADAIQNQARGFRIAQQAASDPTLISYLVGEACEAIALRGMGDILSLSGPNSEVAAQVTQAVKDAHPHLSLAYALTGETTLQAASMKMIRGKLPQDGLTGLAAAISQLTDGGGSPPKGLEAASDADKQFAADWLDESEAIILNRMRALIAAADLPLAARRQAFTMPADTLPPALSILTNILFPVFAPMAEHPARLQAREAVLLAGAAVMGSWTKDTGFPAALPGAFTDPYTGKPLGYRREGDSGFIVYSAGPDGTFDGGKPGDNLPSGEFVFRYPTEAVPVPPNMLK